MCNIVDVIYYVRHKINTGVLIQLFSSPDDIASKGALRSGKYQGGMRLQSIKGLGKLLLSAYIMKQIKSGRAQKGGGIIGKYARLVLGALFFKEAQINEI